MQMGFTVSTQFYSLGFAATAHLGIIGNIMASGIIFMTQNGAKWINRSNCSSLICDGFIELDDTPGLGIELNKEVRIISAR